MQEAGYDATATRFGLHSHGQYVDWKQGIVFSDNPDDELTCSTKGVTHTFEHVIPSHLLQLKASDMLDIMGFSSYPDPMRPADPSSISSMQDTLGRLRKTLGLMDHIAQRYGKHTSGPFTGQYKKQALAVEYATHFKHPEETAHQQQHTQMYFEVMKSYPWVLGALWYEPTYCFCNWEGGQGSLYHGWANGAERHEAPTAALATWGSFAHSPGAASPGLAEGRRLHSHLGHALAKLSLGQ